MRKMFKKLTCLALTLVMCVSFLGGCNLITTDSERDLNQVIATIQINAESPKEEILKKDVVMAYINYGYYYQQQGSEMGEIVKSIVSQLINNRVYVQNAVNKFDSNSGVYAGMVVDSSKEKWDLTRYLTAEEIIDIEYHTYKDVDELITAYDENKPGDKVQDTLIEEVRTAPTAKETDAHDHGDVDMDKFIKNCKDTDFNKSDRKKAYNEVIEVLDVNELLGKDYDGKIENSDYFKKTLKNYQENEIIDKFEKCIKSDARSKVTFADVENAYLEKYNAQLALDENGFATMLDSASADAPVLVYNGNGSYGYVYNLLLGPGDDVLADVTEVVNNESIADKEARRAEILDNGTIVKDLRSTWILSGYDFDGTKFTGDYALCEDSFEFKGQATLLNEDDGSDDYKAEYRVDSVKEFSVAEFIVEMETYLYGSSSYNAGDKIDGRAVDATGVDNYVQKVNELLFAFSTDPGSLNTYKGYSSAPKADPGKNEKYMTEFANAARKLLTMGNNSYVIAATDYGYHVMFYSEVIDATTYGVDKYNDLTKYLDAFSTKDADTWAEEFASMVANFEDYENTDSYLYKLFNSISSSLADRALSDEQNKILDYVFGDSGCVVKYEDRYADLLGE